MKIDVSKDSISSIFGNKRKYNGAIFMGLGFNAGKLTEKPPSDVKFIKSYNFRYGYWLRYKLSKYYSIGSSIEYYRQEFSLKKPIINDSFKNAKIKYVKQISNNGAISVFNRINFSEDYFFIDFGAFCSYDFYPKITTKSTSENDEYTFKKTIFVKPDIINKLNYGIDFKLNYDFIAIYMRYRISGLYINKTYDLPKYAIGISLDIKDWFDYPENLKLIGDWPEYKF